MVIDPAKAGRNSQFVVVAPISVAIGTVVYSFFGTYRTLFRKESE
jgi:hypothetical protein